MKSNEIIEKEQGKFERIKECKQYIRKRTILQRLTKLAKEFKNYRMEAE